MILNETKKYFKNKFIKQIGEKNIMEDIIKKILTTDKLYDSIGRQFYSKYRFGQLTKFYAKEDELKILFDGVEFLKNFKNKYSGKRCFVIGNGPSLNKQDLTLMKDEFTIGSNYLYHNIEKMRFLPTIFTIVNYLVAEQRIDEINALKTIKIFPYFLNYCIKQDSNTVFLNSHAIKNFPQDILKNISWQSTVTFFNLQLAYWLGFSEVYLVGVDNSYKQPKGGQEGSMVQQEEDDPNHFSKSYFKGLQWQKADTDAMEAMYKYIKIAFENDNRIVYNATHGGKLEIFTRKSYESLFRDNPMSCSPLLFKDNFNNQMKKTKKILVSINPDLKDDFGHYLHYDRTVFDNLSEEQYLISLGNKSVEYNMGRENKWINPTFTKQSWDLGRRIKNPSSNDLEQFKVELYNAIAQLEVLNLGKVFYMYTGSIQHAKVILELIEEKNLSFVFHINLFWEHFNVDSWSLEKDFLNEIKHNEYIKLYVDSQELELSLSKVTDFSASLWPMFSITNFKKYDTNHKVNLKELNILFPGNLRIEKGYGLTVNSANNMVNDKRYNQHNFIVRSVALNGTSKEAIAFSNLIDEKIIVLSGVLSEEEYVYMFNEADIIVIPYTVAEFKTRTSGVLADSIMSQKPVLTVKGTWMGNIVEKYANGLVFEDNNENDLVEKMKILIDNYAYYRDNARKIYDIWNKDNNVDKLIELFCGEI